MRRQARRLVGHVLVRVRPPHENERKPETRLATKGSFRQVARRVALSPSSLPFLLHLPSFAHICDDHEWPAAARAAPTGWQRFFLVAL